MSTQPLALRLADRLSGHGGLTFVEMHAAAAELRRLHFKCEEMTALAEPVQEPVAQVHPNHLKPTDDGKPWCREVLLYSGDHNGDLSKGENYRVKLYTAPPQRPVEPIEPTPTFHVEPLKWGCGVCRIGADGKAYGYVCPRLDCPTKVTCGGAV